MSNLEINRTYFYDAETGLEFDIKFLGEYPVSARVKGTHFGWRDIQCRAGAWRIPMDLPKRYEVGKLLDEIIAENTK